MEMQPSTWPLLSLQRPPRRQQQAEQERCERKASALVTMTDFFLMQRVRRGAQSRRPDHLPCFRGSQQLEQQPKAADALVHQSHTAPNNDI